jgi:hypothetical protein
LKGAARRARVFSNERPSQTPAKMKAVSSTLLPAKTRARDAPPPLKVQGARVKVAVQLDQVRLRFVELLQKADVEARLRVAAQPDHVRLRGDKVFELF